MVEGSILAGKWLEPLGEAAEKARDRRRRWRGCGREWGASLFIHAL